MDSLCIEPRERSPECAGSRPAPSASRVQAYAPSAPAGVQRGEERCGAPRLVLVVEPEYQVGIQPALRQLRLDAPPLTGEP